MKKGTRLEYPDNYRGKDYRMPRSMREAYGYEPLLFGQHESDKGDKVVVWLAVMVAGFLIGFVVIPHFFGGK